MHTQALQIPAQKSISKTSKFVVDLHSVSKKISITIINFYASEFHYFKFSDFLIPVSHNSLTLILPRSRTGTR